MKHLIITFLAVFTLNFSSSTAFAEADCHLLTGTVFVCYFDGTSGLEIFENPEGLQITRTATAENGSTITNVKAPKLIGHQLDIKNCVSEAFLNEAMATCVLKNEMDRSGFSTARRISNKYSTARPVPQKTVIRRVDAR